MSYKKTITVTVDKDVHQKLVDMGYRGTISQICEEALLNVISKTSKKSIDRLSEIPQIWLMKAKSRMKDNPAHYAEIWADIINKKCGTEITAQDLLNRFYPTMRGSHA